MVKWISETQAGVMFTSFKVESINHLILTNLPRPNICTNIYKEISGNTDVHISLLPSRRDQLVSD